MGAVECSRALPPWDLNGARGVMGPYRLFLCFCPTFDWPLWVRSWENSVIEILLLLINY